MKTNIYWPFYKNIENELIKLSYDIYFDDNQLNVYSSKITELILRAAIEVESISKVLYLAHGGSNLKNFKYDDVALKNLNDIWKLELKVVIISFSNCYFSNRILFPFVKNDITNLKKPTYSWNNSYQNLKHDRANSLSYGSVKYLFEIMSALYILNLYYKDEVFNVTDMSGTDFNTSVGSDIFSIKCHKIRSYNYQRYNKSKDFDECTYVVKLEDDYRAKYVAHCEEQQQEIFEYIINHSKYKIFCEEHNLNTFDEVFETYKTENPRKTFPLYILGDVELMKMHNKINDDKFYKDNKPKYHVISNKHDIPEFVPY